MITKQEAETLTRQMVDYFCELLSFEHSDDINITIVDYPDDSIGTSVYTFPEYKTFDLKINISDSTGCGEAIENQICHELAHIFTSEYFLLMYSIFGKINNNSTEYRQFTISDERVAMRLSRIFIALWDREQELETMYANYGDIINATAN